MTEFEAKVLSLLEAINTNLSNIDTKLRSREQVSDALLSQTAEGVRGEDPNSIKALIVLKGTSLSEIARSARVSRQWISMVVNGHRRSPRIRKAIADALGMKVEDLWPNGNNKAA